ncbi:MAG: hypothetical protein ACXWC6_18530 [Ramlibacter sp.]
MRDTIALEQAVGRLDQHLRWARGYNVPGLGEAELRWASHVVSAHRPDGAALCRNADSLLGQKAGLRSPQLLELLEQLVHPPH